MPVIRFFVTFAFILQFLLTFVPKKDRLPDIFYRLSCAHTKKCIKFATRCRKKRMKVSLSLKRSPDSLFLTRKSKVKL